MRNVLTSFGRKSILSLLLLGATCGGWWLLSSLGGKDKSGEKGEVLRSRKKSARSSRLISDASQTRIKVNSAMRSNPSKATRDGWEDDLLLSDAANATLTEEYRQILKDLQSALDDAEFGEGGRKRLLAYVDGLLKRLQGGEKLPLLVQSGMIRALASCGTEGASELAGCLAWADVSLSGDVANAFEEVLIDADGDRELSAIVKSAVKGLVDENLLEGIMSELGSMRNSVRVETAIAIYNSGNPAAVKALENNLSTYFGDQEGFVVKNRADVVEYGKNNPDGENDEEFYGPWQHDSATDNVN